MTTIVISETTPASELITHVKTTVVQRLRQLARRNQRIIVATQYLVGASTFLLPLRAANYELYTEASYSLSQLIAFFNNILLNDGENHSNSIDMQYILWFVTRTVCHLEVFLEKFSLVCWGEQAKSLFVLAIELAKATSRLILLLRRRGNASSGGTNSPIMLLGWAREYPSVDDGGHGGGVSLDLEHYLAHYQQGHIDAWQRQRQHASRTQMMRSGTVSSRGSRYHHDDDDDNDALSMLIRHRSPSPHHQTSSSDHRNTTTASPVTSGNDELGRFVGRRSGMVLMSPVSTGTGSVIYNTPSKLAPTSPASRRLNDSDNMGGVDGITTLPVTSVLATTFTPKRMTKWDQTWDDDDESQAMTLTPTPAPLAALQNSNLQTNQAASSSSASIISKSRQGEDDGLLPLPPTRDRDPPREGRGGSPETEGSTDADSFDSKGAGEAEEGAREIGRGGNGKKGWVVWNLQGSDDHEQQATARQMEIPSSSPSPPSSPHDSNSSSSSSSNSSSGSSDSSRSSSFPFTADQALLFAELLYILRPVV